MKISPSVPNSSSGNGRRARAGKRRRNANPLPQFLRRDFERRCADLLRLTNSNLTAALEQCERLRLDAEAAAYPNAVAESFRIVAVCHLRLGNHAAAESALAESQRRFGALLDKSGEAQALLGLGHLRFTQGRYAEAFSAFSRVRAFAETSDNPTLLARALSNVGSIYVVLGDLGTALDLYLQSLALETALGNTDALPPLHSNIANLYTDFGDYDAALAQYLRALELVQPLGDVRTEAVILSNIAGAYRRLGNARNALRFAEQGHRLRRRLREKQYESALLHEIGAAHRMLGNATKAGKAYQRSLSLSKTLDDQHGVVRAARSLGNLALDLARYDQAERYLQDALEIAERLGAKPMQHDIHESLSRLHRLTGNLAAALEHHTRFHALYAEVFRENAAAKLANFRVLHGVREAQAENEKLRRALAERQHELAALAKSLVKKNEAVDRLKAELSALAGNSSAAPSYSQLLDRIEQSRAPERDWVTFEKQFTLLHQDFMRSLSAQYPALTPMELRVCALLKIHLSTKDISKLLSVSGRTVETHRYRIHKKLSLNTKQGLVSFLAAL